MNVSLGTCYPSAVDLIFVRVTQARLISHKRTPQPGRAFSISFPKAAGAATHGEPVARNDHHKVSM